MSDRGAARRVSQALLVAGGVLAVVAVGAWTLDALPALPEWMLRLAVYKLTLASGAALMIAGAVLRRALRESSRSRTARGTDRADAPAIGEGAAPDIATGERTASHVDRCPGA